MKGYFTKDHRAEVNMKDLPTDPGLQPRITNYSINDQDQVRKEYLLAGPCQPRDHAF
ncbi:hypothetical protein KSP40_PGU000035 [Platanthera guangdongensis]|uniref:Uncharacterized protein n=1 Tax=Platanthera guangdongensis TaxID=2320717 RepID=A0ABR2LTV5_9ASPA